MLMGSHLDLPHFCGYPESAWPHEANKWTVHAKLPASEVICITGIIQILIKKRGLIMETATYIPEGPLGTEELRKMDAYWRAALYLCVGMIYLHNNPLLR
jgi:hypothetical protein